MKSSLIILLLLLLTGCASNTANYRDAPARPTIYTSSSEIESSTSGIGIESQDIINVTD